MFLIIFLGLVCSVERYKCLKFGKRTNSGKRTYFVKCTYFEILLTFVFWKAYISEYYTVEMIYCYKSWKCCSVCCKSIIATTTNSKQQTIQMSDGLASKGLAFVMYALVDWLLPNSLLWYFWGYFILVTLSFCRLVR